MTARITARWVLATLYMTVGALHLLTPATFLLIMPDWVPFPRPVVLATGVAEIVGSIALLTARWRQAGGIALALYAVCVFPANIHHAIAGLPPGHIQFGWWYHAPRIALQPVLVWWALYVSHVLDWPFGRKPRLPTAIHASRSLGQCAGAWFTGLRGPPPKPCANPARNAPTDHRSTLLLRRTKSGSIHP